MTENIGLGWEQDIFRILQDNALKAALTMTINEILELIHSKQTRQQIVDLRAKI